MAQRFCIALRRAVLAGRRTTDTGDQLQPSDRILAMPGIGSATSVHLLGDPAGKGALARGQTVYALSLTSRFVHRRHRWERGRNFGLSRHRMQLNCRGEEVSTPVNVRR